MQTLPSPTDGAWETVNESLKPVLMTRDLAQKYIFELSTCNCKKSACRDVLCTSRTNELSCTEVCSCMAEESCMNNFNVTVESADLQDK